MLGEGGFGITYLGLDVKLERRVAVKEYFPTSLVKREASVTLEVTCYTESGTQHYEKGRERFLTEARTLAKLDHIPQIVRVLDFFPAHNTAYIVMEFLEGVTLKDLLDRRGPLPAQELLPMLEPVIRAMAAMHEAGVIHRDVSPDNLMRMADGSLKLMDFGCARELDQSRSMTVMLKHGFAPYEQYTGKNQGPWSDIYGLCATAYYCLTKRIPVDAMDRQDEEQDPLVPPTQLGAALTGQQERALLLGLSVRVQDRWQKDEDLYGALYQKAMDGGPWTPPELWTRPVGKTERVDSRSGTEDRKTPDREEEKAPWKRSPLAKRTKVLLAAAAACLVVTAAALALPALRSPVQEDPITTADGTVRLPPSEEDGQEEETLTGDAADVLPDDLLPQDEDQPEDPSDDQNDTRDQPSGTGGQTSAGGSGSSSSSGGSGSSGGSSGSGSSGFSSSSGGSSGQTTPPKETTPAAPTKAELESQAETAVKNQKFSEAAEVYRQMNSLGYISREKLASCLLDVGSDAEVYWYDTDFGNNSSSYIRVAFELFTESANLGNTLAYASVAYCYDYGHYVDYNPAKACEWWTKLANTGDGPACYFVAQYYADGNGVAQNTQTAIDWLNKCFSYGASYVEENARALLETLQGG